MRTTIQITLLTVFTGLVVASVVLFWQDRVVTAWILVTSSFAAAVIKGWFSPTDRRQHMDRLLHALGHGCLLWGAYTSLAGLILSAGHPLGSLVHPLLFISVPAVLIGSALRRSDRPAT